MNTWVLFPYYALAAVVCWLVAACLQLTKRQERFRNAGIILACSLGLLSMLLFTAQLWVQLERPPMRTLGETRLWYALFMPIVGLAALIRWQYKWLLNYSLLMASLFLLLNYLHPETYSKTLMPALQSVWFIPHVLVYIFAYALLAASSMVAVWGLHRLRHTTLDLTYLETTNRLVYIGFGFLTLGLLFGALWAKEAWGHYWTWDPKETWALLTWLAYLAYIHIRLRHPERHKPALWVLAMAFVVLIICWFGINYLPSAAQSVHTYSN